MYIYLIVHTAPVKIEHREINNDLLFFRLTPHLLDSMSYRLTNGVQFIRDAFFLFRSNQTVCYALKLSRPRAYCRSAGRALGRSYVHQMSAEIALAEQLLFKARSIYKRVGVDPGLTAHIIEHIYKILCRKVTGCSGGKWAAAQTAER